MNNLFLESVKQNGIIKKQIDDFMADVIKENERKWAEYDKSCNVAYEKAQAIVNTKFVETFNDTFYCEVDKYGLPDGFTPVENRKRGNIKKDWLKIYIWNLIYDILHNGCYVGIEKINGKWENIVDNDRHFVRTDKFFGVFLIDYKMEQMFPYDDERFRNYRRFTRLRIKLNSPNGEWIKAI